MAIAPVAGRAEPSLSALAAQIEALQKENRQMKAAIASMRSENTRTARTVRRVSERPRPEGRPALPVLAAGEGEPPLITPDKKIKFGAITITPGGFFAAENVFRSRATNAEMTSYPMNIPFGPQAGVHEDRFSARQSRLALLVEGAITPSLIASGYGEIDFNNQGLSSNYNQVNAWVPRVRNLYAGLDSSDYGFHLLVGQNWSLTTLNGKGITPRNEVLPPLIDGNLMTGFTYKRQAQVRLVKDFDRKLWLALSVENPQTTYSNCTTGINATVIGTGVAGVTCDVVGTTTLSTVATAATGAATAQTLSLNYLPDIVGKAAYEARLGDRDIHLEAFGLLHQMTDRVAYANNTTSNRTAEGFGGGFGVVAPIIPKRLDAQVSGLIGRGIGSYGPAQFADATFNADGSPHPISEQIFNGGVTAHVTPALDVYAFAGVETVQPAYFGAGAGATGYGLPTANNSGCFNVVTAGACTANTKRVFEITGGFWDKLYKGRFGEVRVGVNYAYFERQLFQGTAAGVANNLGFAPKQNESVVMTSFRYYPFQ